MLKQTLCLLFTCLLLPSAVFAQEGFSPFTTDFTAAEFAARRAEVYH